jgi:hypothetical protein
MAPLNGPSDGGSPIAILPDQSLSSIAVDGTSIYWTPSAAAFVGKVFRGGLPDGSGRVALASGLNGPGQLVVDGANAYWIDGREIMKAPLTGVPDGSRPTVVVPAQGQEVPWSIAVDKSYLYWTGDGGLRRVPLNGIADGGAPEVLMSGSQRAPLAIDSTSVYWVTPTALMKLAR